MSARVSMSKYQETLEWPVTSSIYVCSFSPTLVSQAPDTACEQPAEHGQLLPCLDLCKRLDTDTNSNRDHVESVA
jgi:hypothetical protein